MKKIILSFITLFLLLPPFLILNMYSKKIIEIKTDDFQISKNLLYSVENIDYNQNVFTFFGWVVIPGVKQGYAVLDNKSIWLQNQQTKKMYKLKSQASSVRSYEITKLVGDGTDYQSAAFKTSVNLSQFILDDTFDIYICIQYRGQNLLVKTDYYINSSGIYNTL